MSPFDKEFEVMCFLKDTKFLSGSCTYEQLSKRFGEEIVKKLMIEENLIGYSQNSEGLDWTDLGWSVMSPV